MSVENCPCWLTTNSIAFCISSLVIVAVLAPRRASGLGARQFHGDGRPVSLAAADVDCTTVVADYLIDNREAEAGAAGRRGGERLEEALDLRGRHPAPGVREGDADAPLRQRLHLGAQRAALGHRDQGVAGEVPEDLFD